MKNKWIKKSGDLLVPIVSDVTDQTAALLSQVSLFANSSSIDLSPFEEELKNLKKRKLVQQVTRKSYRVTKGPEFREKRLRKIADLNKSMLGSKNEVSSICYSLRSHDTFRLINHRSLHSCTDASRQPLE
jgi:phenylalanyl-tRNA synthetase alpha chain